MRQSLQHTAAHRKILYDVKAVNRKFAVGSWVLWYYPPAAQKKLGSPWIGHQQVVHKATGHTVGIQKDPEAPIIFIKCGRFEDMPTTQSSNMDTRTIESTVTVCQHGGFSNSSPSVDVST